MLDNAEEYENPILYDIENQGAIETPFLLKYARRQGWTAVDLACGTGRVTIPMAENGIDVLGIDIHKGMLEQAKQKTKLPIIWKCQDCTRLNLEQEYRFIYMVGNSFQHFLTNEDQNRLLESVGNHLVVNGIFIFNTRFPNVEELLQPPTEEYWRSYINNEGQNVDVYTISHYDSLSQIQHYTTIRRMENNEENKTQLSLRYVYPMEMERDY